MIFLRRSTFIQWFQYTERRHQQSKHNGAYLCININKDLVDFHSNNFHKIKRFNSVESSSVKKKRKAKLCTPFFFNLEHNLVCISIALFTSNIKRLLKRYSCQIRNYVLFPEYTVQFFSGTSQNIKYEAVQI